jgi:putative ABC transport system permease protein
MGWASGLGNNVEGFGKKGKVIGVVKNFYYKSLHNMVEPLVLVYNSFPVSTIMVKTKPEHLPMIKSLWQKQFPGIPFEYSFLDDVLNHQYQQDQIIMNLFNDFTILAIFVSCLGLYGLVSLITVQRSKEMGIRKVLGAHPRQLFSLLANDFLKLVGWALVIALPLAGMAMNKWLSGYAYHVDVKWWFFIIPLLSLPIIAIAVISREVIRAAMTNPVNSLRAE